MRRQSAWIARAAATSTLLLCGMIALTMLLATAWHVVPAQAAGPETEIKAQHGAWQLACKVPEGAKIEICAVIQDVTSETNPNVGLGVRIQTAGNGDRILRVFAPLGVLLTRQLRLQIDETTVGHAPFIRCGAYGCMAQVTLTEDVIERLKTGTTAWFVVFQSEEAGVGIPVALQGFADTYAELK